MRLRENLSVLMYNVHLLLACRLDKFKVDPRDTNPAQVGRLGKHVDLHDMAARASLQDATSSPPSNALQTTLTGATPILVEHTSSALLYSNSILPSAVLADDNSAHPTTAPSPEVANGEKRGLSYNEANLLQLFADTGMTWAYNWDARPNGAMPPGVEYVPMCWGPRSLDSCADAAQQAIKAGSTHVLSFNEPDHAEQANMPVGEAVSAHIMHLNPLSGTARVGSPAITNGPPPMGIQYLEEFLTRCAGQCAVDFITCHWYDQSADLEVFTRHLTEVTEVAKRHQIDAIWLTEFALSPTQVDSFLDDALSFLDQHDTVERYAYFMVTEGSLVSGDQLTPLGKTYAGIGSA